MRFIAVLDDCNDSRRLAMTQCRKKGKERGCEGEERKKGRKGGRGGFKGEGREKERKEGRKRGKRRVKGERGREEERALLASAVHVARAPYMNVTQDVAVGLSCILCTPTLEYPEYEACLRPNILNTMHASDRFARFFMKIANKFA